MVLESHLFAFQLLPYITNNSDTVMNAMQMVVHITCYGQTKMVIFILDNILRKWNRYEQHEQSIHYLNLN